MKRDWTPEDLARQSEAAAALVAYLAQAFEDDPDLINDTIEGETDFLETIDRALEQIAEADMMATAITARIGVLNQRKKRFDDRAKFLRHCIEMAMAQANGERDLSEEPFTLVTPGATVTLRLGNQKVLIDDEAELPAKFYRTPDPVIDKKKLNEYVARWRDFWAGENTEVIDGAEVEEFPEELPPGVSLSDRPYQLTIRTK